MTSFPLIDIMTYRPTESHTRAGHYTTIDKGQINYQSDSNSSFIYHGELSTRGSRSSTFKADAIMCRSTSLTILLTL